MPNIEGYQFTSNLYVSFIIVKDGWIESNRGSQCSLSCRSKPGIKLVQRQCIKSPPRCKGQSVYTETCQANTSCPFHGIYQTMPFLQAPLYILSFYYVYRSYNSCHDNLDVNSEQPRNDKYKMFSNYQHFKF